jgi:hypothetical protein
MLSAKQMTRSFYKDEESQDSDVSSIIESKVIPPSLSLIYNNPAIKVASLNELDGTMRDFLTQTREKVSNEISRGYSENTIKPGFYTEDGLDYLVMPEGLFKEDDALSGMIFDLCKNVGVTLKILEQPAPRTQVYDEKFTRGLWFGFFTNVALKRRKEKKSYELGRSCAYSLIVKSVFEDTDELGPSALLRDNFFFGNNPMEKSSNGSKVPFYLKMKLRSFFEDPGMGDIILGFLNKVAQLIGVSHLTEVESDKMIKESLIPVDKLISDCYPSITVGKGKKTSIKKKKPNPIRTSPLYHKKEMELVTAITSPLFSELDYIVKDYENSVFSKGFKALQERIRLIINIRWETLQRFANRTKIRLQDIRKITKDDKLRKANVLPEHVTALLRDQPEMPMRLVREIQHIVGKQDIMYLYSSTFKQAPESVAQTWGLVYKKAYNLYNEIDEAVSKKAGTPKQTLEAPDLSMDYAKAFSHLARLQNNFGDLIKQTRLVSNTKYFKLWGRLKSIEDLQKSVVKSVKNLSLINIAPRDMAVSIYYEEFYKNYDELITNYRSSLSKAYEKMQKQIDISLKFEQQEAARKALLTFVTKIESFHVEWESSFS